VTWRKLGLQLGCRLPLAAADLPRPLVARALAAGITDLGTLNCRVHPSGPEPVDGGPPFAVSPAESLAIRMACNPDRVLVAYLRIASALAERN
jgi:hypothetical protein